MILRPIRFLPENAVAGGALPWVIGVMVYLCALAMGFGFAMNSAIGSWADTLTNQVSVQIVHADKAERESQAAAAMALLEKVPGLQSVHRIDAAEIKALLEPWLGVGNVTDDLPIPILLEIILTPGRRIDLKALGAQLHTVAPDAAIDDHGQWLVRLRRLAGGLELTALIVVGLIFAATAAIAAFGTRAGLAGHRDSIETMHMMGAEDDMIAGEFRYRFMVQGFKGGAGGLLFSLVTLYSIDHFAEQLGRGLVPALEFSVFEWLYFLLLPAFAALLTLTAAHVTVRRELARMT